MFQVIATMIISLHDHPIGASDKEMSKWVLGNITRIHNKMHCIEQEFAKEIELSIPKKNL
jgi:hypothetical protein